MPTLRYRLTLFAAIASLAVALPACGTDDAVKKDTNDAVQELDKGAGNVDEKTKDAAQDAADEVEKGLKDIDGN